MALATTLLAVFALSFPVRTLTAWRQQAENMVTRGLMTKKCFAGLNMTAGNLAETSWLRNRLGLRLAFVEDPLLSG